jgi:translation initiation factor 6
VPVDRATIAGSPYVGVYVRAGERGAVLPPSAPVSLERGIQRLFGVFTVRTTVFESEIVGALVAFNSHGAVVGDRMDESELQQLERVAPVTELPTRQNALGNNVLANDRGAVVHPDLPDTVVSGLRAALGVPVRRGTIAGLGTVGMAGAATNLGAVVHPKATERESRLLEEVLAVPVHRSTANFGVPVVGACLVANSRALLTGRPTTPVELVHLQEGLKIFD